MLKKFLQREKSDGIASKQADIIFAVAENPALLPALIEYGQNVESSTEGTVLEISPETKQSLQKGNVFKALEDLRAISPDWATGVIRALYYDDYGSI